VLADDDEVADLEGAVEQDGEVGEQVPEDGLRREGDRDPADAEPRDDGPSR